MTTEELAVKVADVADGEALSDYTAAQIKTLGKAAYDWGYVCRNYYALLKVWIARETDRTVLAGIDFGKALPDDLMTELGKELSGKGLDISKYAAALSAA